MQSKEEILRVMMDWFAYYAPKNMRQDEQTGALLAEWCLQNERGITSFSGLDRAVQALGPQVLVPEESKDQIAAERVARELREQIKSKPGIAEMNLANKGNDNAATQKAEADAKELASIKEKITRTIESYLRGHVSGGVNYTATETGRNKLRDVAGNYQALTSIKEAKSILEKVEAAKSRLA